MSQFLVGLHTASVRAQRAQKPPRSPIPSRARHEQAGDDPVLTLQHRPEPGMPHPQTKIETQIDDQRQQPSEGEQTI